MSEPTALSAVTLAEALTSYETLINAYINALFHHTMVGSGLYPDEGVGLASRLTGWRQEIRDFEESPGSAASAAPETCQEAPLSFAPIVVAAATAPPPKGPSAAGVIEIVIGDCIVHVVSQIETGALAVVLRTVRRSA